MPCGNHLIRTCACRQAKYKIKRCIKCGQVVGECVACSGRRVVTVLGASSYRLEPTADAPSPPRFVRLAESPVLDLARPEPYLIPDPRPAQERGPPAYAGRGLAAYDDDGMAERERGVRRKKHRHRRHKRKPRVSQLGRDMCFSMNESFDTDGSSVKKEMHEHVSMHRVDTSESSSSR